MSETPAFDFPTQEICEGQTRALVPIVATTRGPASSRAIPVFYNPAMALSRDIGVMVMAGLKTLDKLPKGAHLEGLTATGLRGLRLAVEADIENLVLNDANPLATRLAGHNIELNGVSGNVEVTNSRLQVLLAARRFGVIDIDPFGTPAPYLDGALQALVNGGLIALSATDLPGLCGAQPKVAWRRYGATPLRGPACTEFGVRLLLGWLVRRAAVYEWGVTPLLAYGQGHHLRVYARLRRGAGRADESLAKLGMVARVEGAGDYLRGPAIGDEKKASGPFWLGPLLEGDTLKAMEAGGGLACGRDAGRLLERWRAELSLAEVVGFFGMDELARAAGCGPPATLKLVEALKEAGFQASASAFDPKGVRTSAPWQSGVELVAQLASRESPRR